MSSHLYIYVLYMLAAVGVQDELNIPPTCMQIIHHGFSKTALSWLDRTFIQGDYKQTTLKVVDIPFSRFLCPMLDCRLLLVLWRYAFFREESLVIVSHPGS
jgi:hypothetical protein